MFSLKRGERVFVFTSLADKSSCLFFMLFVEECLCERVCVHSVFRDLLERINNMRVKQSQRGLFALL